ncbi:MAG: 2-keto-4-pentenoate hydratase [Clostridiales bacterium]|nr:2-keto-4-pentenoate hydratase [Clostridiales bacterium]
MEQDRIRAFALELFEAERNRLPVAPLTDRADMTVYAAYMIQMENIKRVESMGYHVSGKKIGLTSLGMQEQLGVHEPDYGHLFSAMDCSAGMVNASELIQPKIEAEVAFVLKKELPGGFVTAEEVCAAADYVTAAFEIVDSRVADWRIKLPDTIADNASSGRYILGGKRVGVSRVDLPSEHMRLWKNDVCIDEGTGAAVLGNPIIAVAWLANKLWEYGSPLKAGEVILSGAFTAAPAAVKGDRFRAEFSTLGIVEGEFL